MGLYLPPELRWLGWVAGGAWPDGDETEIWHVSDAYKDAGNSLEKLIPDIEDVKRIAVSAYPEGTGGDKIGAAFDQMLRGDQSMESLAKFMEQISDAVFDFGTQVEAAKLMTIVSLIALAIEIAWAWMWPPTAPAVEAAETAATQCVLRRLELQFQERILAKVLSVFGTRFA
ncbi:WXG100-like domain-containing protein, partial [Nocardia gipuzkoensis]